MSNFVPDEYSSIEELRDYLSWAKNRDREPDKLAARLSARSELARSQAFAVTELRTLTPDQVADWIETNVTTLASAKTALKLLARMLIALRNHAFPDLPD